MIISNDLKINDSHYKFCEEGKYSEKTYLGGLSKINIFIGSNSSGKSRLLRHFFNSEVKFMRKYESLLNNEKDLNSLCDEIDYYFQEHTIGELNPLKKKFINLKTYLERKDENREKIIENLKEIWDKNNKTKQKNDNDEYNARSSIQKFTDIIDNYFSGIIGATNEDDNNKYKFKRIYIPTLRGLRHLNDENKDFYHERTNKDYFTNLNENKEIYTGLNYYDLLKKYLLGDLKQRELINDYQKYLSETFFDGKEITLIPREKDDEEKNRIVWVKIGNEKENPIYELGDGIQSIIIITLPLFLNLKDFVENENVLVFIEEPEQHLHPGLQRKLIETFHDEKFKNYQFFFTTHSNHFLDSILYYDDISIFSLDKTLDTKSNEVEPKFSIKIISKDNNLLKTIQQILKNIGAFPSSVFVHNCTIYVEGKLDISYYEKYLELYRKSLENCKTGEEHELYYNFFPGGGDQIEYFIKKQNNKQNVFFIVGGDKKDKYQRLFNENNVNENYCIIDCCEIENSLPKKVICGIIESYEEVNNDSICDFKYADYQHEKIAEYIDKKILKLPDGKAIFRKFKNGKPTKNLRNKKDFNSKALEILNNMVFDDLSEEAKEVTMKIHKFIESKNS